MSDLKKLSEETRRLIRGSENALLDFKETVKSVERDV